MATHVFVLMSLLQLNAAVSTSLAPDANHKTVNAILLGWLATDDIASSDMETLLSIAGQCPLEGGDAVYEARSLVSHLAGMEFDDRDLCGTQNRQVKGKKSPTLDRVIVFPNPTTGQINWTGAENVAIRVLNAQGQLVREIRRAEGSADLGNLPQGVYVVQVFSAENVLLTTQKIQLVKP
ncbi:MAG: T9SS type A sorting domain-containing protein [Lewinellaceae bacterium]|nr:T9SS type A sorting domain-containing protein [Lewinellaceae bacterium]